MLKILNKTICLLRKTILLIFTKNQFENVTQNLLNVGEIRKKSFISVTLYKFDELDHFSPPKLTFFLHS